MVARRYILWMYLLGAIVEIIMAKQNQQQLKIRFFDDSDHLKLKEIAEKEDRSLTYVVNQAIKQFLQTKESAKA
ncbi:hypothetical protein RPT31_002967 [Acinetobacter baumannii]|uniref:Uncharacterized protein n=2 Tax=Acinetobacter TaxID=469 RepID=A0AAD2YRT1_ACIBA|nr:hypothetical protein CCO27_15560 [Acinetobacter baumannii]EIO2224753.1 hypothetical protein [Acinetobacter baumannii]EKT8341368.1 hypothetical protein [Acinetobacter baumannii]EKT8441592.1 hypothetical protein [Acinetobacter baumannii]EKT9394615.1 hypothetical protein [Acinetobacter baumannii]